MGDRKLKHRKGQMARRLVYFCIVVLIYKAYKALGGNTFVDHIYSEIEEWEVLS